MCLLCTGKYGSFKNIKFLECLKNLYASFLLIPRQEVEKLHFRIFKLADPHNVSRVRDNTLKKENPFLELSF